MPVCGASLTEARDPEPEKGMRVFRQYQVADSTQLSHQQLSTRGLPSLRKTMRLVCRT
jgi:hypothetical protein